MRWLRGREHRQPSASSDAVRLLEEKVELQGRLRAALADVDRYGLALHWLLHDYSLTFALFKLDELILQQRELHAVAQGDTPHLISLRSYLLISSSSTLH